MAIRLRTKKLIYSGLAGAGIMLLLTSGGGYLAYSKVQEREIALKQEYKGKMDALQLVADQSENALALNRNVAKGEQITESMLTEVYVPEGAAASDRFLSNTWEAGDVPYYAKTDLTEGMILTDSIVYADEMITNDIREGEYAFIELPSKLEVGKYIDIRIQFPTGDDFVLFSKKKVKDALGVTVWFDIDEGEIMTMSSAIVDAYENGAKIYAMSYVDEHMQEKAEMNYPVKLNVKELIEKDPNIVNIAKLNLEMQNRARVEENLKVMDETTKEKIKSGEAATKNAVSQDQEKRSAEERINAINEQAQQEQLELVGGSEGGSN
ncbi:SAF domain-containing protein [Lysinibacillus sp. NPDC093712]|uniref:SAF domain-containing protein n=1 Tax=Lysinibacillus sp. NPDC093712 TaxID=3390579 RepID=UPI003CFBF4E0